MKDGRVNLKLVYEGKTAHDLSLNTKDIQDLYRDLFLHYRKPIISGDTIILFNERAQLYIGAPELNPDGWDIGKLGLIGVPLTLTKEKKEAILTNEVITIQSTKSYTTGYDFLYASSGGWGFFDKRNEEDKKQLWKVVKLNLLKEDGFTKETELYTGDIVRLENIHYPQSNLYGSTNNYLANSYYYSDKWIILSDGIKK